MSVERRVAEWRGQPLSGRTSGLTRLANYLAPRPWLLPTATVSSLLCLLIWLEYISLQSIEGARIEDIVVIVLAACLGTPLSVWGNRYFAANATQILRRDYRDSLPRLEVQITFEVDGHVYGEDKGELTLVEDWLIFEGERTSFSLSPYDVTERRRRLDELNRRESVVMIRNTGAGVSLKIVSEEVNRDPMDFLHSWMYSEVEYPGVSVLPPLQPMPGLKRGRFSKFAKAPLRVIVLSLLPTLYIASALQGAVAMTVFWAGVFAAFFVYILSTQLHRRRAFRYLARFNSELVTADAEIDAIESSFDRQNRYLPHDRGK